jgi:preprotein translocase subunit SecF
MQLFGDTHIDFMKYRKFWIVVSFVLLAVGIFSVFVHGKLNIGIDFAGGTQLTLKFKEAVEPAELRGVLAGAGVADAQIQRFGEAGEHEAIVKAPLAVDGAEGAAAETGAEGGPDAGAEGGADRSRKAIVEALDARYNQGRTGIDLNRAGASEIATALLGGIREVRSEADLARQADALAVADAILDARREVGLFTDWDEVVAAPGVDAEALSRLQSTAYLGEFALLGVESVGPQIGEELRTKGILAVILSMIGMMVYISLRFELRFGIGALMATIHDVLVCLGFYALAGFEFNLTTIAAFLTLVGYSVNDTVVIFDRVRENMRRSRRMPLVDLMNLSLNQTLSRTLLTSGTTLLAVGSLLLIGGDVLRGFAFVITVGVIVGTYSSIYIAGPFTLLWEQLFGGEARARRQERSSRAA